MNDELCAEPARCARSAISALAVVVVLTRSLQCRKQRQRCQRGFGDVTVAEVKAAWLKVVVH